ncbi:MAG: S-adenosyl-methyltransferase [Flavobacteriia bacterium]|nr:MAG: S-adenosyl-methyltransferase [Flavobacteriia bacterium]
MSKTKQTLYGILKGGFLVDKDAQKNWGFIIFLTVLALLMIASSHNVEKKVKYISQLNKKNRELRSQFIATRSDLMQLKMESSINKELKNRGFYGYLDPPQKIKVIIKE